MYKWISVKEDLPKLKLIRDIFNRPEGYVSDVVLVCVESIECDGIHYFVSTDLMKGHSEEDADWLMRCGYGESAVKQQRITHWMPLPKPPKM